jgi:hypothetical protein
MVNDEEGKPALVRFNILQANLPKGPGLNYEVLESTFGRGKKLNR